jgi:flagellar biosynthesis/type III secretory pathway M-ring protein FliF/YscJ
MAEKSEDDEKLDREDREQRMERLRHLLNERGEDAAKMVKTWLSQNADENNN